MDYYTEEDDLEYFLKPTRKNRRILIGFFIFIACVVGFIAWIQVMTATYADVRMLDMFVIRRTLRMLVLVNLMVYDLLLCSFI